jgi:hypothetical protein
VRWGRQNKKFLGLIARCKDEYFINEFCDHYLREGVDSIFIIDDDSNDKSIYNNLTDTRINVIFEKGIIKNNYSQQLYEEIRFHFDWIIYVDVDEFITTKKNLSKTIRFELSTFFKNCECVKIPWVMMSCNGIKNSPENILTTITHRWNHDKKHPHSVRKFRCRYDQIEVKCIFRPECFETIGDHNPYNSQKNCPKVVNGTDGKLATLDPFYRNLREEDIRQAVLLCYHYRIISVENCIRKMRTNQFYNGGTYSLEDLMSSDHAEMWDDTLKLKSNRS